MTYTILFTDKAHHTAAIIVVYYEEGDTTPGIIRHANQKGVEYEKAYLLEEDDFGEKPFYNRQPGEEGHEVNYALAVLQEHLDGTPAKGGLAFGRKQE